MTRQAFTEGFFAGGDILGSGNSRRADHDQHCELQNAHRLSFRAYANVVSSGRYARPGELPPDPRLHGVAGKKG
jgi:hypothetical protein